MNKTKRKNIRNRKSKKNKKGGMNNGGVQQSKGNQASNAFPLLEQQQQAATLGAAAKMFQQAQQQAQQQSQLSDYIQSANLLAPEFMYTKLAWLLDNADYKMSGYTKSPNNWSAFHELMAWYNTYLKRYHEFHMHLYRTIPAWSNATPYYVGTAREDIPPYIQATGHRRPSFSLPSYTEDKGLFREWMNKEQERRNDLELFRNGIAYWIYKYRHLYPKHTKFFNYVMSKINEYKQVHKYPSNYLN